MYAPAYLPVCLRNLCVVGHLVFATDNLVVLFVRRSPRDHNIERAAPVVVEQPIVVSPIHLLSPIIRLPCSFSVPRFRRDLR